jgi:hypothetical protein
LDTQAKTAELLAKARRCRKLAQSATDLQVADALREVAKDIEAVISISQSR